MSAYDLVMQLPASHQEVPLTQARRNFGPIVDQALLANVRTVITSHRRPKAVVVPYEWYVEACRKTGTTPPQGPEPVTADAPGE